MDKTASQALSRANMLRSIWKIERGEIDMLKNKQV
jgi:hypothetical protein